LEAYGGGWEGLGEKGSAHASSDMEKEVSGEAGGCPFDTYGGGWEGLGEKGSAHADSNADKDVSLESCGGSAGARTILPLLFDSQGRYNVSKIKESSNGDP
jgi:hypothetical protein